MRLLKISADLKSLPAEYASWYFTVACENGPVVNSASAPEVCSAVIPFSSPNVAYGDLKLEIYAVKTETKTKEDSTEKENLSENDQIHSQSETLVATRTITIQTDDRELTTDLKLKVSSGDLIDSTASFHHEWCDASHTSVLPCLRVPHLNISISLDFSDLVLCEDMSLRIIDSDGKCLAIQNTTSESPSATIFLSKKYANQSLELSVASKSSGVFTTPLQEGWPLVMKINSEQEDDKFILLSTVINVFEGTEERLMSIGAIHLSRPQSVPSTPSDLLLYHIEIVENDNSSEQSAVLDADRVSEIMASIVDGPVLSRLELPNNSGQSSPSRSGYLVGRIQAPLAQDDDQCITKELNTRPPRLILYKSTAIKDDCPPVIRLSALSVRFGLMASCLLHEVYRSSIPTVEDGGNTTEIDIVKFRGGVEYTPHERSLDTFKVGDAIELTCAIHAKSSPVVSIAVESSNKSEENTNTLENSSGEGNLNIVENKEMDSIELTADLQSAIIEPASERMSHTSSTQSLLNELGRILKSDNASSENIDKGSSLHLIDMLSNEIKEKQRLVDRLLTENSAKAQTIAQQSKCTESLHKEISKLKVCLAENRAALSYREQESSAAVRLAENGVDSHTSLQQYSRPVLIQTVIECCNRLKKVDQERLGLKKIMGDSVSIRKQFAALNKAYRELQDAHMSQSKHIQKMQKQYDKVKTYQNTIVMQEKVISKMQSVIESHLRTSATTNNTSMVALSHRSGGGGDRHRSSNAPSRHRKVPAEKDVNKPLRDGQSPSVLSDDYKPVSPARISSSFEDEIAKLKAEVSSKDIRIDALQDQLTISAAEASREIASLRTRLFELEITGHDSSINGSENGIPEVHEISPALSSELLVPFQHSLRKENDSLRQQILSVRSRSSTSHDGPASSRTSLFDVKIPNSITNDDFPKAQSSFVDLSGTTHHDRISQRPTSISLSNAYRPSSITGSPRPYSPSSDSEPAHSIASVVTGRSRKSNIVGEIGNDFDILKMSPGEQQLESTVQGQLHSDVGKMDSRLRSLSGSESRTYDIL